MGVDEAIEAEAQAQAICMQTEDFKRAYRAFVAKQKPASKATEPWPARSAASAPITYSTI